MRTTLTRRWLIGLAGLALAGAALAGPRVRLTFPDGSRVEGELLSYADGRYQVAVGGQALSFAEGDLSQVELLPGEVPRAAPAPGPGPQAPSPSPPPTPPAPSPRPTAAPPAAAQPPVPDGQADLRRAFGWEPRPGDRLRIRAWEQVHSRQGDRTNDRGWELRWTEEVLAAEEGEIRRRLRAYTLWRGDEAEAVAGLVVELDTPPEGPITIRAREGVLSPALEALIRKELEEAGGLPSDEFLPEVPVAPGEQWTLALSDSRLATQVAALGMQLDPSRSQGVGTLAELGPEELEVALSLRLVPSAVDKLPLEEGRDVVLYSSTRLRARRDGRCPPLRVEESGRFEARVGGELTTMEVSSGREVELLGAARQRD